MRTSRATLRQQLLTLSLILVATRVASALHPVHALHQRSEPAPVAFEVAFVKSANGAEGSVSRLLSRGYSATNVTLRSLIADAYLVRPSQVIGGPAWLDSDRFDIDAQAPQGTPRSEYLPMLKTLLADRFKLVLHEEQRDQPIHALTLATGDGEPGPHLQPSPRACPPLMPGYRRGSRGGCAVKISVIGRKTTIEGRRLSMIETAEALSDIGLGPVIDRTGLVGAFDFELRFTRETLVRAMSQQLGLTLEPIRYPIQSLVIDSVQRPTPD